MQTECTPKLFEFEAVERRSVVAGFDGGNITSNAGALLLGQVDRGLGLVRRFADCSSIDYRSARCWRGRRGVNDRESTTRQGFRCEGDARGRG